MPDKCLIHSVEHPHTLACPSFLVLAKFIYLYAVADSRTLRIAGMMNSTSEVAGITYDVKFETTYDACSVIENVLARIFYI